LSAVSSAVSSAVAVSAEVEAVSAEVEAVFAEVEAVSAEVEAVFAEGEGTEADVWAHEGGYKLTHGEHALPCFRLKAGLRTIRCHKDSVTD
jgi:hypothetical protein